MTKRLATVTSAILLVLGIAAFTGSALAGNGNGNGPASQGAPPASPGNSANAPGQVKKDSASTQAKGGGSADQNTATSAGVKPTNATHKDTHAAASSNQTKRYGNGQTAGQIAVQNGAPGSTILHGPGNSQPHKAVLCPGSKHEVDVHALKAKGQQKKCGTSSPSTTHVSSSQASVHVSGGVAGATTGVAPTTQGGVLGATAAQSQPAGGVLGAIESVGQGVLPFTGFPLWIAVLIAVALIAFGLALRRGARATV